MKTMNMPMIKKILQMANEIVKAKGYEQFIFMQGHYNLIFREEEREMKKYCDENNIAMTPYNALASDRLAKIPGEKSKRLSEDSYAKEGNITSAVKM